MSGAEDTAAPWGVTREVVVPLRGRLVRKYTLLFIALVGAALIGSSGLDFWFSYQENKEALVRVQQEKADAAAQRIEEFIGEIERQIGWTTNAQWSAGPLDQRRFDYVRLQRQVPAITELSELDAKGKEQLKVSRLAMAWSAAARISPLRPRLPRPRPTASGSAPYIFERSPSPT